MTGESAAVFATPEAAVTALLRAIQTEDYPRFLSIAGSHMVEFWFTDDPERDEIMRHLFLDAALRRGVTIESVTPDQKKLYVDGHAYLFPAPLVKTRAGWRFDDEAGFSELASRRIRRDETAAIESCRRFLNAEMVHAGSALARVIRASPGDQGGWVAADEGEEDQSTIGPAFAAAFTDQQTSDKPRPFFGYYFKILASQSPHSSSELTPDGVGLIAWPANYGQSGVRTFVINSLGELYQKDLSYATEDAANSMTFFRPDSSWRKVDDE
jgi:hypothetical protein